MLTAPLVFAEDALNTLGTTIALFLSGTAPALTIEVPVNATTVQERPNKFDVTAERRDDGLLHYRITRKLTAPRYLVAHFRVRSASGSIESHAPAFVREGSATYYLTIPPDRIATATFDLSEHGFDDIGVPPNTSPIPWVGGLIYQFQLDSFVPSETTD